MGIKTMSNARELLDRLYMMVGHAATKELQDRIRAEQAKPEPGPEPVGIVTDCKHDGLGAQLTTDTWNNPQGLKAGMLLYTSPPARKPLTDDEIEKNIRYGVL